MAKRYHQSKKDRMDESLGMRRGKESTKKQSYKDRRDESKAMYRSKGGSMHRGGHNPHSRYYDSTMNSPRYMEKTVPSCYGYEGEYDKMRHDVAKTVVHNWEEPRDAYPMTQEDNGSMNYLGRKDRLMSEDARRIRSDLLGQDGSKYK